MALADNYRHYDYDENAQRSSGNVKTKTVKRAKSNKIPFTFLDKFLIIGTITLCSLLAVSGVSTMAKTFTVNQENIELKAQVDELTKSNKDLEDTISQLTMSESVIAAANSLGLTMNEDNVKVAE